MSVELRSRKSDTGYEYLTTLHAVVLSDETACVLNSKNMQSDEDESLN